MCSTALPTRHDRDSTAAKYLGVESILLKTSPARARNKSLSIKWTWRAPPNIPPRLRISRCSCIAICGRKSKRCRALKSVYETIEQPLVPVLFRMERTGVFVDRELLKIQSSELAARMLELQAQAHAEAGGAFNVDSPKQLQEILFGKFGIPVTRKTPTGQPSTAEDVLEELAATYPLPKLILEYRGIAKLKSTYTDTLPAANRSGDGTHSYFVSSGGGRHRPAARRRTRICRTSRFAPAKDGGYGRRSLRRRATRWSPPTTRKSSCASWRICRAIRACCGLSPRIATFTRRPPPRCSATPLDAGQRRSAALRQGDQFRLDVRDVGIRSCPSVGHRTRRRAEIHGSLLSSAIPA